MADLFTLVELAALTQGDVDDAAGALLRELVTGLVQAQVPNYDFDTAVPVLVKSVALAAAARAYTNPSGYTSETISAYSYSRPDGRAGVYLTTEEQTLIRRSIYPNRSGISTLTVVRGINSDAIYVEAVTSGEPTPDPASAASWPLPFEG